MGYKVLLDPSAEKELNNAPREVQSKIAAVIDLLEKKPYAGKLLDGKFKGLRSIRAWPYRVIYEIYENKLIVYILRIRHRKDAYR